jgi:Na+-driven multidrug efflux pump
MPMLRLLNIPIAIIDEAYTYIFPLLVFAVMPFLYNLCAGLLRSIGNSFVPMLFLIFSAILNIILNILLVIVFQSGILGIAMGTVLTQAISVILCVIYIFKKCPELVPSRHHFRFEAVLYKDLITQGLSMGFMMSIVSLGSIVLQRAINGLGYLVIAGHIAARRLYSFFVLPIVAIALSMSTFVSQNKGADKPDRIRKGLRYGNLIALGWGLFSTILLLFFATHLMRLITGSDEYIIIENGSRYLMITAPFFLMLGVLLNLRFALQGIGSKIMPVVSSIIELFGKVVFAFFVIPISGYTGVIITEPVIWIIMCTQLLIAFYTNPYIKNKGNEDLQ